ncbi:hypothetical protein HC931_08685 [Candidatus Gracilibacteria bacterium]|nr:hypothetical protein [Candidatus Gracilibacteria bacterium]NJM85873.1 hypothetical protein [Hydrococcus sp. RU_2_2]NJQ96695.1 hypothetical protein [Hydrococcus sp. CSU_1_8]
MTELDAKLKMVSDRESFFDFVRALIADRENEVTKERIDPNSSYFLNTNKWENETIESFLESALACAEATEMGQTQGLPEELSWKSFATFLYCGKIYE